MGTIIGWGVNVGTIKGYIWGLYEDCCKARIHKKGLL